MRWCDYNIAMVRNKKRKTESLGQTDPSLMTQTVELVMGGQAIRQTAKALEVSKSCLQRYVNRANLEGRTGM